MTRFKIIEARAHHCGIMARRCRAEHLWAMRRAGMNPHLELRRRFYDSAYRKTWLINGEIAAMGGVTGAALCSEGQVWLALSDAAMRHPLAVVREAQRQLDAIMRTKRHLGTFLLGGDERALRFAEFLGFSGADGRYMDENPEYRIPLGAGYCVPIHFEGRV